MLNRHERIGLLSNAAFSTDGADPGYTRGVIDTTARVLGCEVEELANVLGINLYPELDNLPAPPKRELTGVEDVDLPPEGGVIEVGGKTVEVDDKGKWTPPDDEAEFVPIVHLRGLDKSRSACGRAAADATLVDGDKVDTVTCKRCPNTLLYDKAMTAWMRQQEAETA